MSKQIFELTPVRRSGKGRTSPLQLAFHRVAVVSLPFYTQYTACLPAMLLREITKAHGAEADLFAGHIEFALEFIRSQRDHDVYKDLTHEASFADLCLLPLLRGWDETDMRAGLDAYADRISAPDREFRDRLGAAFDSYLDALVERLHGYDVIALTATHFQLVPSLLLAERLKSRYGSTGPKVVLGGYLASIENARLLLEQHQDVDVIVYGEGEDVWPRVMRALEQGRRKVVRGSAASFRNFFPKHDDLLRQVARVPWLKGRFAATLEISRGCYWDKCDFCNFNAAYDAVFKAHAAERTLAEMDRLEREFGQRKFQFTDTAIPRTLTRHLIQQDLRRDWDVFLEIRPDFDYYEYEALQRLGTIRVQIGIESIVESHLDRMNKNSTVGDNVRALLICQQLDIAPTWGLLINHPNETVEELDATLERMRAWRHLPPPKYASFCELRVGSALDQQRDEILSAPVYPCPAYALLLPLRPECADFVPVESSDQPADPERVSRLKLIQREIDAWQADYDAGSRLLGRLTESGLVEISDRRRPGHEQIDLLNEHASAVIRTMANGALTVEEITALVSCSTSAAQQLCSELVDAGYAFWSVQRRSARPVLEGLVGGLIAAAAPLPERVS
ncbi:B12-binding domain-containing radical SAM protein [Streptacidiphilus anmyonensis]|uniref:B12-binding domain-containing radical SAM protein n=1 Tax=Streptacidiphilus anmyonensis TaxID=405782 RepID=UPI0005AB8DA1|nr:radical SAM protein [Streptacidiphilus anmyonensis]